MPFTRAAAPHARAPSPGVCYCRKRNDSSNDSSSQTNSVNLDNLQQGKDSLDKSDKSKMSDNSDQSLSDGLPSEEPAASTSISTPAAVDISIYRRGSAALEVRNISITVKICLLKKYLSKQFFLNSTTLKPNENDTIECDYLGDILEPLCSAARLAEINQQQQWTVAVSNSNGNSRRFTLCQRFRYYPKDSRGTRSAILAFKPAPDNNGMHMARIRLATLANCHGVAPQLRRQLAAAGWYLTDQSQQAQQLTCAFCKGSVTLAEVLEAARNSAENENGAARLHRVKFATCPWVLEMDVGNEPEMPNVRPNTDEGVQDVDSTTSMATECSEGHDSEPQIAWSYSSDAFPILTSSMPAVLVSPEVARAACNPSVVLNLDVFERSIPRDPQAAASLRPMHHPRMERPEYREATLANRSDIRAPAHLLASAGFFADEIDTSVIRCYWCDLQLHICREAEVELNPWIEHSRWSPRCSHLLKELGAKFVREARNLRPPTVGETWSGSPATGEAGSVLLGSPRFDFPIDSRSLRAREDTKMFAAAARIAGPVDAKTALEERLRTTGDDFPSGLGLLTASLDVRNRRREMKMSATEFREHRLAEFERRRCIEAEPLAEDDELDWRACKVCMSRVINLILLDCRHLCCCSNCARSLDSCPVCRTPIRATLLIQE